MRRGDRLRTANHGGHLMEPQTHDPVLRLAAWLRSARLRAGRSKAAYGCGSAPVSDRLTQTAGVRWSNAPTPLWGCQKT